MSCECLEMLRKKLVEQTGDPRIELDLVAVMDVKGDGNWLRPAPLRFTYRKLKKDGFFAFKKTKSFVVDTYCRFCGVRYEEEDKDG